MIDIGQTNGAHGAAEQYGRIQLQNGDVIYNFALIVLRMYNCLDDLCGCLENVC